MSATYAELKRQVLLKLKKNDGLAILATEQAINDALKMIATVKDFDELMALCTTAATVDGTKSYSMDSDLALTRPKDIYSIRLMDTDNSRKLQYVPFQQLDNLIPYTEQTGEGRPSYYTRRGRDIELYQIPDAAYTLYIQYSKWPATLDEDTDTIEYVNIDPAIVQLAADMAQASLDGTDVDWMQRAVTLLGMVTREEGSRPDERLVARPFCPVPPGLPGEYWNNPFIRNV